MKRTLVSLSLMLVIGTTPVLANRETKVDDKAKKSLLKEFVGADLVEWTDLGDYKMALFVFNGYRVEAYFNADGEMAGFDRYISSNQLPLEVLRSFSKRFPNGTILDVLEITNTDGTSYRLTVETPAKLYQVKISATGTILKKVEQGNRPA
jgi:hypothetical protein